MDVLREYFAFKTRFIRRRISGIHRKLITVITCVLLIAMVTWATNQRARTLHSTSQVHGKTFGIERISSKGRRNERTKYLSYQPPGGGWNNQRIAFENAVIMAAILERTLLVQPMAPHDRMLQLMTQHNLSAGYTIYNMLTANELVPISKLIDLNRLSSLLPVQEITSEHSEFLKKYNISSWYKVCHNGLARAWIDKIHSGFNTSDLHLEKYSENFKNLSNIAQYRKVCLDKTENELAPWEFLPELRKRDEEIIYFEKGSLFVRQLFFADYKRALSAQKAVVDYIQPAQEVLRKVARIIHIIKKPFSATHVRRTDHQTGRSLSIHHWLSQLTKAKALQYSNKLYIATDETNLTWFAPLKDAGYNILFAKDFEIFRQIEESSPVTGNDIIGFYEQVLCSHAKIFIESYYSTFSQIIKRYREAQHWDRKHFRNFVFSPVKWLDIYR